MGIDKRTRSLSSKREAIEKSKAKHPFKVRRNYSVPCMRNYSALHEDERLTTTASKNSFSTTYLYEEDETSSVENKPSQSDLADNSSDSHSSSQWKRSNSHETVKPANIIDEEEEEKGQHNSVSNSVSSSSNNNKKTTAQTTEKHTVVDISDNSEHNKQDRAASSSIPTDSNPSQTEIQTQTQIPTPTKTADSNRDVLFLENPAIKHASDVVMNLDTSNRLVDGHEDIDVTCPICMEVFEDPRELDCEHCFCLECTIQIKLQQLQSQMVMKERQLSPPKEDGNDTHLLLICPICRIETFLENGDVFKLPSKQGLSEAIAKTMEKQNDPNTLYLCHRHGKALTQICMTCEDRICDECPKTSHNNHSVVSYEGLQSLEVLIASREIELKKSTSKTIEHINIITQSLIRSLESRKQMLIDNLQEMTDLELNSLGEKKEDVLNMINIRTHRVRNITIDKAQKAADTKIIVEVDTSEGLNKIDWGLVISRRHYDRKRSHEIIKAVSPRCIGKVSGGSEYKYAKPCSAVLDYQRQRLYVADRVACKVFMYDYAYFALPFLGIIPCKGFNPLSVAMDTIKGHMYVCGRTAEGLFSGSRLKIFILMTAMSSSEVQKGHILGSFEVHGSGLCVDDDARRLYVSDSSGALVRIYDIDKANPTPHLMASYRRPKSFDRKSISITMSGDGRYTSSSTNKEKDTNRVTGSNISGSNSSSSSSSNNNNNSNSNDVSEVATDEKDYQGSYNARHRVSAGSEDAIKVNLVKHEGTRHSSPVVRKKPIKYYDPYNNNTCVYNGILFISFVNSGCISVYNVSADACDFICNLGLPEVLLSEGRAFAPMGMSIQANENLYVTDISHQKVIVFDVSGLWNNQQYNNNESISVSTPTYSSSPVPIPTTFLLDEVNSSSIGIQDSASFTSVDTSSAAFENNTKLMDNLRSVISTHGSGKGSPGRRKASISSSSTSTLTSASMQLKRVPSMRRDTSLNIEYLGDFGSEGVGSFNFNFPIDIAVDKYGPRLFVVDTDNSRMCVWESR